MAKNWKKVIKKQSPDNFAQPSNKRQETAISLDTQALLGELAKEDTTLNTLLKEREHLEKNIEKLTGKEQSKYSGKMYDHEIISIDQRRKEEKKQEKKRQKLYKKLKDRKSDTANIKREKTQKPKPKEPTARKQKELPVDTIGETTFDKKEKLLFENILHKHKKKSNGLSSNKKEKHPVKKTKKQEKDKLFDVSSFAPKDKIKQHHHIEDVYKQLDKRLERAVSLSKNVIEGKNKSFEKHKSLLPNSLKENLVKKTNQIQNKKSISEKWERIKNKSKEVLSVKKKYEDSVAQIFSNHIIDQKDELRAQLAADILSEKKAQTQAEEKRETVKKEREQMKMNERRQQRKEEDKREQRKQRVKDKYD